MRRRVLLAVVVLATAVAVCRAAEVEAETDPHRLLADKREKLRAVSAKAARDTAAEAPLQEFEITDAGVSEVKTVPHDTKNVPKSVYYTSASSSGAVAGAALEHTVLMAVTETIRAAVPGTANAKPVVQRPVMLESHADAEAEADAEADPAPAATAAAPAPAPAPAAAAAAAAGAKADAAPKPEAVNGLAHDASEVKGGKKAPSHAALKKAAAKKAKAKGTLKCQCTFQPLPDRLPPLTPDQKNPKGAAEKEKKREQDLLKKLAKPATKPASKPTAAPAAAAPAAPAAAATPAAAAPAAPASAGTITPLKLVETRANAAYAPQTELATNADSSAPGAAPLYNADYHQSEALTDASFVALDEAVAEADADADADADSDADADADTDDAEEADADETEAEADA